MKTSLLLATSVFTKGYKGRGKGGANRVLDSEARCGLRDQDGMDLCCANEDYGQGACSHVNGCIPALLEQGLPCNQHSNNCMCDDACVHFDGKNFRSIVLYFQTWNKTVARITKTLALNITTKYGRQVQQPTLLIQQQTTQQQRSQQPLQSRNLALASCKCRSTRRCRENRRKKRVESWAASSPTFRMKPNLQFSTNLTSPNIIGWEWCEAKRESTSLMSKIASPLQYQTGITESQITAAATNVASKSTQAANGMTSNAVMRDK